VAFEFVGKTIKAQVSAGVSAAKGAAIGTAQEFLGPGVVRTMGDVFSKVSSGIGKQMERSQSASMSAIGGQIGEAQAKSASSLGGQIEKSQDESTYRMVQSIGEVKESIDDLREVVMVSGEQSEFQLKKLRGDMDGGEGFFGRIFGKQSRIGKFFSGMGKVLGTAARGFGTIISGAAKGFGTVAKVAGKGLAPLLGVAGKGIGIGAKAIGSMVMSIVPMLGSALAVAAPAIALAAAGAIGFAIGTFLNKLIDKAFGETGGLGKWVYDFLHDPETGIFPRVGKLFGDAWAGVKSLVCCWNCGGLDNWGFENNRRED